MLSEHRLSRRAFTLGASSVVLAPNSALLAAAQTISDDAVDVRKFGARGDGKHDDTAAFAAAIRSVQRLYVPAGNYLVDHIMIPAGRTVVTDGYSTHIMQRRGTLATACIINVVGSNVRVGDVSLEGNIGSDTGEFHHGVFIGASRQTGQLSNIRLGNVRGKNIRGDVVYIGSADGTAVRRIRVGRVLGTNILRNVLSVVGGFDIGVQAVSGSNVGYTHVDIEPEDYSGPVVGCMIGSVQGSFVQIAGQTSKAFVDHVYVGAIDLIGTLPPSIPRYLPGLVRSDALTLRNVRSVEIGRFVARSFEGAAIRQVWDPRSVTDQRVKITTAKLSDCCRNPKEKAYVQGNKRATLLDVGTLTIDIERAGVHAIYNCKEVRVGHVQGKFPKDLRIVAESPSLSLKVLYALGAAAALSTLSHLARRSFS